MKREINLNNFLHDKTVIFLEENFRKSLFQKSIKKLGSVKNFKEYLGNKSYNVISAWKYGKIKRNRNWITKQGIPLNQLIKICKLNKLNINSIQKQVICYKSFAKSLKINNPLLPIKIKPELFRIIAHMISDGSALNNNTHYYKNNKKELLLQLRRDLKLVFGDVETTLRENILIIPSIIMKTICNYFEFQAGTFDSSVPKILFKLPKNYASKFVQAFFDDEGTVATSNIRFYSFNKQLIKQIRNLLILKFPELKETNKLKQRKRKTGIEYSFSIGSKELKKYYNLIGICHLDKQEKVKFILKRQNKNWNHRNKEISKLMILNSLLSKSSTTQEIAQEVFISKDKVAEHLRGYSENRKKNYEGLIKRNFVKRKRMGKYNSYVYSITKQGVNYLNNNPFNSTNNGGNYER